MPAPTSITDLSTTASSNYPAGTDLPSALDDAVRALASVVKYNVSKGTDIASASSITIPAQGSYFVVTGTTTITTIADTNAFAGREVTLKFSGALTLTHSAGLILPGAANITTAAGAVAKVVFESTGVWRCTSYAPGDIAPVSQALSTSSSPQFTAINLGHASDTTLTRASAGVVAVEGTNLVKAGDVTSNGVTMSTARLLGRTTASTGAIEEISVGTGLTLSGGSLAASGVLTLGTAQASTSGTSIDFTSIPAGTNLIIISFIGVSTSGTSGVIVQLGDSGGVETSGYLGCAYRNAYTNYTAGIGISSANAAASVYHGLVILSRADGNTWGAGVFMGQSDTNYTGVGGASKSLSAELDRVRITTVGGSDTFDAGTLNISYM